jgi:iron-sulfur cluster repair protein YtfE (RIC family)
VTNTETGAFEAMLAHHQALEENVAIRVAALAGAATAGNAHEVPTAELTAYLTDEVLPHALAEEQTIYRVARTRAGLANTVSEMIDEHRSLASAIEQLAGVSTGSDAARQAESISALFAAHVAKENELLLPVLLADDEVDLRQLLAQMQRLTESAHEAQHPTPKG